MTDVLENTAATAANATYKEALTVAHSFMIGATEAVTSIESEKKDLEAQLSTLAHELTQAYLVAEAAKVAHATMAGAAGIASATASKVRMWLYGGVGASTVAMLAAGAWKLGWL